MNANELIIDSNENREELINDLTSLVLDIEALQHFGPSCGVDEAATRRKIDELFRRPECNITPQVRNRETAADAYNYFVRAVQNAYTNDLCDYHVAPRRNSDLRSEGSDNMLRMAAGPRMRLGGF